MCIGLFNFLLPPSVSGRRNLSCLSRPKVNVRGCTVSLRKPRPCGDPGEPLRVPGKSRKKQKLPAPLSCVDPTVYLFIYLFGCFFVVVVVFSYYGCFWAVCDQYFIISYLPAKKKKKKSVWGFAQARAPKHTALLRSAQMTLNSRRSFQNRPGRF